MKVIIIVILGVFMGCVCFQQKNSLSQIITLRQGDLDTTVTFDYLGKQCHFNKSNFICYVSETQIQDIVFKDSLVKTLQKRKIKCDTIDIIKDPRLFGICEKYVAKSLLKGIGDIRYIDSGKQIEKIEYKKYRKKENGNFKIKEEFVDMETKKIILERILNIS